MGRHAAVGKQASGVVICIPGNDDNTKLKAYSSISLLSGMRNVVEKVVAGLSSADVARRAILSEGHFSSRKGRSTINAASILVDRAHATWTHSHITGVLLMDMKATFTSVAEGRLVNWMKVRQIDGDHIRWTESFLSPRTVETIIDGNTMERHPVDAGVPLGSPRSPILFAMYTAGLIKWVEQYVSAEGPLVVDNPGWVATGCDVNLVVMTLESYAVKGIE